MNFLEFESKKLHWWPKKCFKFKLKSLVWRSITVKSWEWDIIEIWGLKYDFNIVIQFKPSFIDFSIHWTEIEAPKPDNLKAYVNVGI